MGRTVDDGRDKPAIYKLYDYTMGNTAFFLNDAMNVFSSFVLLFA
jgi:hypothetical protein